MAHLNEAGRHGGRQADFYIRPKPTSMFFEISARLEFEISAAYRHSAATSSEAPMSR
jgi:hypothetical protein